MEVKEKNHFLLGVPLSNFTKKTMIQKILDKIEGFKKDHQSRYISTVNSDFYANLHGWLPGTIRHEELLRILRNSSLLTADGMPLLWLCRLLGCPLKERITGIDLLHPLLALMAKQNGKIFLLGPEPATTIAAKKIILKKYQGLEITGSCCPKIFIEGEELVHAFEQDELILEQIHKSQPDLLLISLGNPKQEIWFERVQNRLQVPISIGIGGSLSFIAGTIPRAPTWIQNLGLEWLYRLIQEPSRLFTRYLYDFAKMITLSVPLLLYHWGNLGFIKFFRKKQLQDLHTTKSLLFLSEKKSLAMVSLPALITQKTYETIKHQINESISHDVLIFDFHRVQHIDLHGIELLYSTWKIAKQRNHPLYALGISKRIEVLLKLHKAWDFLCHNVCQNPSDILNRLCGKKQALYDSIQQKGNTVILTFLGELDHRHDFKMHLQKLTPMLMGKKCIIDLTYCTYIDNSGFQFLLILRDLVLQSHNSIYLYDLSPKVKRMFKIAKVNHLFPEVDHY